VDVDVELLTPSTGGHAPQAVGPDSTAAPNRRPLVLAAVGVALVSLTILGTWAALHGSASAAAARPEVAPSATVATPATHAAVVPAVGAPVATVDPQPANAATATVTASAESAPPKFFTQAGGPGLRNRPPAPTTASASAAAVTPPPTATNPGPKAAWDPDSRLPPP